ncbi:MAG: alpha-L-fucosidase, partial [Candidatus Latescibacterota bacterium]
MKNTDDHFPSRRTFIKTASAAAVGAAAMSGQASGSQPARAAAWFKNTKRMLHLDSHFYGFQNVYSGFDAEKAAQMYADAGFQMVSFFAKCGGGYSYYPTKIGVMHPTCRANYTGELTAALKKRNVRRLHYFAIPCERESHKKHPDWVLNITPDTWSKEKVIAQESVSMCYNSPYVDEVAIPQMKEIVGMYDTDDFFIDGIVQPFLQMNCY